MSVSVNEHHRTVVRAVFAIGAGIPLPRAHPSSTCFIPLSPWARMIASELEPGAYSSTIPQPWLIDDLSPGQPPPDGPTSHARAYLRRQASPFEQLPPQLIASLRPDLSTVSSSYMEIPGLRLRERDLYSHDAYSTGSVRAVHPSQQRPIAADGYRRSRRLKGRSTVPK